MNRIARIMGLILGLAVVTTAVVLLFGTAGAESLTDNVPEFETDGDVLIRYNGSDNKSVTVPEGIREIRDDAFYGHPEIESITLPEGLEKIGFQAFKNSGILALTIPDSVREIASNAFEDCKELTVFHMGNGVEKVGDGLFSGCDSLSKIDLDNSNPNFIFYNGALYNSDMSHLYQILNGAHIRNFTIPSTVTSMSPYCGFGLPNLVNLTTNPDLKTIPAYAFSDCPALLTVTLAGGTDEIEMKAFSDNESLAQVYIPKSVHTIHATAFDHCPALSILSKEGNHAEAYAKENDYRFITDPIYDVSIYTENNTSDITQNDGTDDEEDTTKPGHSGYKIPKSYEDPLNGAQEDGSFYTRVVGDNAVVLINNEDIDVDYGRNTQPEGYEDNSQIPEKAHHMEIALTEFKIDKMVTDIGDFAFSRSGLKSIEIPDNVSTIGYAAFYHCDDLKDVRIADSVTYIGPKAFSYTAWMNDFMSSEAEDDFLVVGDGILIAYKESSEELTIPEGVKRIAPETFKDDAVIKKLILPSTIMELGESSFENCSKLSEVEGINDNVIIKNKAFSGTLVTAR